jgi:hypothetical protein
VLRRPFSAVALVPMPLLSAWRNWARRRERDVLYTVLQVAWWIGSPILSSLRSAFRGSARCVRMAAIKPRRARFSLLTRPA